MTILMLIRDYYANFVEISNDILLVRLGFDCTDDFFPAFTDDFFHHDITQEVSRHASCVF